MMRFAITVFLGAFLLFQVQPILGKYLLPWFGGGASVWTTCMLFFQIGLLGGYLYAHLLRRFLSPTVQGWAHLALLAASLIFLPNPLAWKPEPGGEPIFGILFLLTVNVGVPFLLLSATGPLLQSWFSQTSPGRSPYRLYALSNVASLLALLSYPFLVEPNLTLAWQLWLWKAGHVAFALCCGWCAARFSWQSLSAQPTAKTKTQECVGAAVLEDSQDETMGQAAEETIDQPPRDTFVLPAAPPPQERAADDAPRPTVATVLLWLGLSACGSAMLLATTNQLCQEVAVVPFLWILPLVLYLLTFIICFDSPRWYDRPAFGLFLLFVVPWACVALFRGIHTPMVVQIIVYSLTLFACCMTCHGELVRAKPQPRYLTLFYLMVALGGALGGVFVALVAPLVFLGYWEYHIALSGCCLLTFVAWHRDGFRLAERWLSKAVHWTALDIALLALITVLIIHAGADVHKSYYVTRDFYGVLRVLYDGEAAEPTLELVHGRISHGFQYCQAPRSHEPTSYYTPFSGVGQGVRLCRQHRKGPLRIGVIGLGTGTMAAHGQSGDVIRFYEISPKVKALSDREYFTYLKDSQAHVDVVLGDARIRMEQELRDRQPQQLDLLAVDAFSSDAIPIHLLTKECGEMYWKHLKRDGVLAIHISNRFLELGPVTRGLAAARPNCEAVRLSAGDNYPGQSASTWVLLISDPDLLRLAESLCEGEDPLAEIYSPWTEKDRPPLLWTDDFHSLWQVRN
jgi:spermidine synthase